MLQICKGPRETKRPGAFGICRVESGACTVSDGREGLVRCPSPAMSETSSTAASAEAVPEDLAAAIAAASASPAEMDRWEEVDNLAADHQRPEEAAALYSEVIQRELPKDVGLALCKRAASFHAEWFGDGPAVVAALQRAVEIDATASFAFQRLTMLLTVDRRWDELLGLYDRILEATPDGRRRVELFTEAAQIAKDLAGLPGRAIGYLEALARLSPSDGQIASSLERLLDREGRYRELVTLWRERLPSLGEDAARARRAQIAACLLDRLESPDEALVEVEELMADPQSAPAALELLERIFASPKASAEVQGRAMRELRRYYTFVGRVDQIVRVLGIALGIAEGAAKVELHREIAELSVGQGDEAGAITHYADLLALDPQDGRAVQRLRELTSRAGQGERYAAALTRAADACEAREGSEPELHARGVELLYDAATVRVDELDDAAGGTALFARIFHTAGVDDALALEVSRRLDALLHEAGDPKARLEVLERRAGLEPEKRERRRLLGEAARSAEAQGDADRALGDWARALEADAGDREAHDASIALLEAAGRWPELITALTRSAHAPGAGDEARAHLVKAARVHEEKLGAMNAAIDAWHEIEGFFGPNDETVDALVGLLQKADRWDELSEVLDKGLREATDPRRRIELRYQLGNVYRVKSKDAARALEAYRAVLEENPAHEGARSGLRALLDDEPTRPLAVELLLAAFDDTGDWAGRLSLLEHRLALGANDDARTDLLREAADLEERRANDPAAALRALTRALPLRPGDTEIERRIQRLAEATGDHAAAAASFAAAGAASEPGARRAELAYQRGLLLEQRLGNLAEALSSYRAALGDAPDRLDAAFAAVRTASLLGRWAAAAETVVGSAVARGSRDAELVSSLEAAASAASAWNEAAQELEGAVAAAEGLDPLAAAELERTIGVWHRDRRIDGPAAEKALLRALAHLGHPGHLTAHGPAAIRIETLGMLAGVQRRAPGRPLVDTLLGLADAGQGVLAALHEAATVAVDVLHDAALARTILERLLGEVSARLAAGEEEAGGTGPGAEPTLETPELAAFVVGALVRLAEAAGDHARAIAILIEAAALPLGLDAARARLHEAAVIAEEKLGDVEQAVGLYQRILADTPRDARALERLSAIFAAGDRLADLLSLRRHELGLATAAAADRIPLRLAVADLYGKLGEEEARRAMLRDNLGDEPGQPQSLAELAGLLTVAGADRDLASLLEDQADQLDQLGERERAAELWTRASTIAEEKLDDVARALASRTRAAEGRPTEDTFDALARLTTRRGEHAAAVGWLEKRLAMLPEAAGDARIATLARLATALHGAGRGAEARARLEEGLAENPGAEALRAPLRAQYRASGAWEELVSVLTAPGERPATLEELREAADVCIKKLGSRERAIPILDAMVALAPKDKAARLTLASALRGSGDLDRARGILGGLLDEYGRRRPPERAEVHYQLAQVALAGGHPGEAKTHLETAVAMSGEHAGALRMLGGIYREAGELEKAERMYGALLLIALRQQPSGEEEAEGQPARSEVMINLHWILGRLGQAGRADEMLASAFDAARRSELEARRLEEALREAKDAKLLLRALEGRLERTVGPARALVLGEIADALGGPLDRPAEAFKALLDALEAYPGSAELRDRAAAMARRAGAFERWTEVLGGLAHRAESEGQSEVGAQLFASLGELYERDLNRPADALAAYERAERLGAESAQNYRAIARVAALVGDASAQIRVLRQLAFTAQGGEDVAALTEDTYRLAELELASPDDVAQGLSSLDAGLSRGTPDYARAGNMLRAAAERSPDPGVLVMYERVARASGDPAMLLDALERASAAPSASMEILREAVDLASARNEPARVEALLGRAVSVGEQSPGGLGEAVWALSRLASMREAEGDARGALGFLGRAVDAAEHDEAQRLTQKSVSIARERLGNETLAAEAYERLLGRDKHDREVWVPLLAIYRTLGNKQALERKLREAIECAFDAGWRAELRLERAKLLLESRPDDAAVELDELLNEDENHDEAASLLTALYERQGKHEALAELIERRLSVSRLLEDPASMLDLSLRLGALWAQDRPEQAIDVYRNALEKSPDDPTLVERLLSLYAGDDHARDRADLLERKVKKLAGAPAAQEALTLADLRARLEDPDGVARALDLGFRADPTNGPIRDRLAALYQEERRFGELASMLEFEGTSQGGEVGLRRLREAAAIYLGELGRPADAARALGIAVARAPESIELLVAHARCLSRAGEKDAALAELGQAIQSGVAKGRDRVSLLKLRAELGSEPHELPAAIADLEAAYQIEPRSVANELANALERRLATPEGQADQAGLLRLVEVLVDLGNEARARDVLADGMGRAPQDPVLLRRAAEIEGYAGRWENAVALTERLFSVSQGPARLEAALLLAGACARGGYPHGARPVLETLLAEAPAETQVRELLRRIYEETHAHVELGNLYLGEAGLANDVGERFAALRKAGQHFLEPTANPNQAIAPLEAARDLRPKDHEVTLLLADAYIRTNRLQEAADFLDQAIAAQKGRRSREVSTLQHRMALIARTVGDRGNELAWLNAAFDSDAQNGEAASQLADVATEFGQLEVAVKALKAITLMKAPKPISRAMAYLRQAMIAQHQGDARKAQMLAKKAQSEDPALEEAGTFLAQLAGA